MYITTINSSNNYSEMYCDEIKFKIYGRYIFALIGCNITECLKSLLCTSKVQSSIQQYGI